MLNCEKEKFEGAINTISETAHRILIEDYYDEYELRQLKKALEMLLKNADGR